METSFVHIEDIIRSLDFDDDHGFLRYIMLNPTLPFVLINEEQETLLHQATRLNNSRVIRLLLDFKADINAKDCHGNTSLHLAVVTQNLQVVRQLIEAGSALDHTNKVTTLSKHMLRRFDKML